jgi:hypothetical protein
VVRHGVGQVRGTVDPGSTLRFGRDDGNWGAAAGMTGSGTLDGLIKFNCSSAAHAFDEHGHGEAEDDAHEQ